MTHLKQAAVVSRTSASGLGLKSASRGIMHVMRMVPPRAVAGAASALPLLDGTYEETVRFSSYANWVVPGTIMQGRYPHMEPETPGLSEEGGRLQLERILQAGLTTFISLQGELPDQVDMPQEGLKGFKPYKTVAEEVVNASGQWRQLHFLHRPVVDMGVPDSSAMRNMIMDLSQRVQSGEVLYIHCHGGRGRSGVLASCLIATMYGLSAEEAIERVSRAYVTRRDGLPGSPDTPKQFDFIRKYIASLSKA
ncbi:MAP kinase phosphatase 6 [Haematococcus lacustris]